MARVQEITVESYVERRDGSRVRVEKLIGEERERLSMAVRCIILNAAFAGTAFFRPPEAYQNDEGAVTAAV